MGRKLFFEHVSSSQIAAIAHDEDNDTLYIKFHSGSTYKYWPITQPEYQAFLTSVSVGSYFHQNIKNNKSINFEKL